MPKPQQILDIERVMRSIDAPHAVVVLIDPGGELETATKGIDNDAALFEVLFSICSQLAAEIFDDLPDAQKRQARLILPTQEEARRLGILNRNGRN